MGMVWVSVWALLGIKHLFRGTLAKMLITVIMQALRGYHLLLCLGKNFLGFGWQESKMTVCACGG